MPLSSIASVSLLAICVGKSAAGASPRQIGSLARQLEPLLEPPRGSGDNICPPGEVLFGFGADLDESCVPNILELYDEILKLGDKQDLVKQDKFCWNDGQQGRGYGEVPDSCFGEYSEWSPTSCYKPCLDGFSSDGVALCIQNCPEGELCPPKKAAIVAGFCSGDYPKFHDGKCYKAGVDFLIEAPGGECPAYYNNVGSSCWKSLPMDVDVKLKNECPADYDFKTPNCEGQSIPVSCPDGYALQGSMCGLITPKVSPKPDANMAVYPRESRVHSCGHNEDYSNGLCYPKCMSDSKGVGSICWPSCPKGTVACGMGCAQDLESCAALTQAQAGAPLPALVQTVFLIATAGASADVSEAAAMAVSATKAEVDADERLWVGRLISEAKAVDVNRVTRAMKQADNFLERVTRNLLLRNPSATPAFNECLKHYKGLQDCLPAAGPAMIQDDSWHLTNCMKHAGKDKCLSNDDWISLGKQIAKMTYVVHVSVDRALDPNSKPADVAVALRTALDVTAEFGFNTAGLLSLGPTYYYPTCDGGKNHGSSSGSTSATSTTGSSTSSSSTKSVDTATYIGIVVGVVGLVSLVALAGYGTVTRGFPGVRGNANALQLSQQQMEEAEGEGEEGDEDNAKLHMGEKELCIKPLSI